MAKVTVEDIQIAAEIVANLVQTPPAAETAAVVVQTAQAVAENRETANRDQKANK